MSRDDLETIGIAVSIAVYLFSVWYSILQSRVQTRSLRSATYSDVYGRLDAFNAFLIENRSLLVDISEGKSDRNILGFGTTRSLVMDRLFTLFEHAYIQREMYGLFDKDQWDAMRHTMTTALKNVPCTKQHWANHRLEYPAKFRLFMDELMRPLSND